MTVTVSTLGEAMLRFSVQPGHRLQDASSYDVHVAGSEANVAYGLARVGVASLWASCLPRNPLARRVSNTLKAGGVDTSAVVWSERGRLGVYFVELARAPRTTYVVYDRAGSTMAHATPDQFNWNRICQTWALHITGITFALSNESWAVAKRAVEEAHERGVLVSFDLNHRNSLWGPSDAARTVDEIAPLVDVFICTEEDAREVFGSQGDTEYIARSLKKTLDVGTIVVTAGASGAVAIGDGRTVARGGYEVEPIDRIGAGDAFAAGLLWGLSEGSLEEGVERGLAMAALKMTTHGDLFTFDAEDVQRLRLGPSREVSR